MIEYGRWRVASGTLLLVARVDRGCVGDIVEDLLVHNVLLVLFSERGGRRRTGKSRVPLPLVSPGLRRRLLDTKERVFLLRRRDGRRYDGDGADGARSGQTTRCYSRCCCRCPQGVSWWGKGDRRLGLLGLLVTDRDQARVLPGKSHCWPWLVAHARESLRRHGDVQQESTRRTFLSRREEEGWCLMCWAEDAPRPCPAREQRSRSAGHRVIGCARSGVQQPFKHVIDPR